MVGGAFVSCPGSGGTIVRVAMGQSFSVVCVPGQDGGQSQSISHQVEASLRPAEPAVPQMARQWLGLTPASDGTLGLSNLEKPGHQRGPSVPQGWKKFYLQ